MNPSGHGAPRAGSQGDPASCVPLPAPTARGRAQDVPGRPSDKWLSFHSAPVSPPNRFSAFSSLTRSPGVGDRLMWLPGMGNALTFRNLFSVLLLGYVLKIALFLAFFPKGLKRPLDQSNKILTFLLYIEHHIIFHLKNCIAFLGLKWKAQVYKYKLYSKKRCFLRGHSQRWLAKFCSLIYLAILRVPKCFIHHSQESWFHDTLWGSVWEVF